MTSEEDEEYKRLSRRMAKAMDDIIIANAIGDKEKIVAANAAWDTLCSIFSAPHKG